MVHVKKYHLSPTHLVPNSPLPLLHYPGLLASQASHSDAPIRVHDIFLQNGWQVQWIYRYGPNQDAHYHSTTHEAMAVLSGEATIRFGVSDAESNVMVEQQQQPSLLEVRARTGDVFVLPAGVAHKTYDANALSEGAKLLVPGDGHRIVDQEGQENAREGLSRVDLEGFTMIGAYPLGSGEWDFNRGGEHQGKYAEIWNIARPEKDPVLGDDPSGLCGLWRT